MMIICRFCGSHARSHFYQDIAPDLIIHGVWYRPTLNELFKMRQNEQMLNHIMSGGLKYRENECHISQEEIMKNYLLKMKETLSESEFEKESLNK